MKIALLFSNFVQKWRKVTDMEFSLNKSWNCQLNDFYKNWIAWAEKSIVFTLSLKNGWIINGKPNRQNLSHIGWINKFCIFIYEQQTDIIISKVKFNLSQKLSVTFSKPKHLHNLLVNLNICNYLRSNWKSKDNYNLRYKLWW